LSISKEAIEKIKIMQKSLENKSVITFRTLNIYEKKAIMLSPEEVIYLFNH
jgi:hypothetical protein